MIFTVRDLGFEIGPFLLEGWWALAARAVCAAVIVFAGLLVGWLLRRKIFPALQARSWHFAATPILLRSLQSPLARMAFYSGLYLALTSLDAVARIGRMSFQELFSVDDMEHAEGWRKLFCNTYFSTIITLAFGFLLTQVGYANIWPLFGSANQLLSALVLVTLCVFLKVTGRNNKMLFPPLIIMLCVTFTALVQRLIAMVKAIQTAASTTIPAGETTWGAVFIANGLQLIIAILLIVLGITIVVNSFKSYAKSEKNSEKASA